MAKLTLGMLLLATVLVGCGSSEPSPEPTASEKADIQQAKGAWNQESLDAFNKAHQRAKSGADEDTNAAPGAHKK